MGDDTNDMLLTGLANSEKLVSPDKRVKVVNVDGIESCMGDENNEHQIQNDDNNHIIPSSKVGGNTGNSQHDAYQEGETGEHNVQNTGEEHNIEPTDKSNKETDEIDAYDNASPIKQRYMKLDMIRKLGELMKKGIKLSQNYNMESDYHMMKYEYDIHSSTRAKHNAVKIMQNMCVGAISLMEMANKKYDPFSLNLDGWSDEVNSDPENLYDIFGEIYEKYNSPGKAVPPEIKLLGILSFSAARIHVAHTMFDKTPSLEDKMKSDPQYLENIRMQATSNHIVDKTQNKEPVYEDKLENKYKEIQKQVDTQLNDINKLNAMETEYKTTQLKMTKPTLPKSLEQPISSRNITQNDFQQFRKDEIAGQLEKMKRDKEQMDRVQQADMLRRKQPETTIIHFDDNVSQQSVVSTNPDLDNILKDVENASQKVIDEMSVDKKKKRRQKKKK